jgi:hypothetical protein
MTLQAVKIKKIHSPDFVTYFVFLQFSGPEPWYAKFYKSGTFDSGFDCPALTFKTTRGTKTLFSTNIYSIW